MLFLKYNITSVYLIIQRPQFFHHVFCKKLVLCFISMYLYIKFLAKLYKHYAKFYLMENIDYKYLAFSKFHGAGNDFIMVNCFKKHFLMTESQICLLCDRRTGIGADGLILLLPSSEHDFKMTYYNSDGREGSFCGNGGRCITAFANNCGIQCHTHTFEAVDGIHHYNVKKMSEKEFMASISMKDVDSYKSVDNTLIVDTGSPHYVTMVHDLKNFDVFNEGAKIRYDKNISTDGINVDFMEVIDNKYNIRTYERGVENETLACGTGTTAAAIAASLWFGGNDININTVLCKLNVKFKREGDKFKDIVLTGPATFVFDGFYIFAN